LTHPRHIGNHRIAIATIIITIDTGQRAAARSFEPLARRAAGCLRVTDSPSDFQPLDDINARDNEMEIKLDAMKMKV
jgi:hypothetical protein